MWQKICGMNDDIVQKEVADDEMYGDFVQNEVADDDIVYWYGIIFYDSAAYGTNNSWYDKERVLSMFWLFEWWFHFETILVCLVLCLLHCLWFYLIEVL